MKTLLLILVSCVIVLAFTGTYWMQMLSCIALGVMALFGTVAMLFDIEIKRIRRGWSVTVYSR